MFIPRKRLFWAVSLGHIVNDMFMSIGSVLLVFTAAYILPISNAQIGIAISAQQFMGAVTQPLFGYIGDKRGARLLGAGGVAWTVGMYMITLLLAGSGQFWLMIVPFALAALGSGAFHPVGTMYAAESDKTRVASNLSYFFFAGQLGLAIGPATVGILLDELHTRNNLFTQGLGPLFAGRLAESGIVTPVMALGLIAIPVVLFMALTIPRQTRQTRAAAAQAEANTPTKTVKVPMKALIILAVVVAMRSLAQPGIVPFIPRMFQLRGWDSAEYGIITSLFWFASGVAGVLFGMLADRYRYDTRWITAISLILSAPCIFLLPFADGIVALILALLAGGLSGGSHSLIIVTAQRLVPGRKGFASGAIMGYLFGTGAIGSLLIGQLSTTLSPDPLQGLSIVFQGVAIITVISGIGSLFLPKDEPEAKDPEPAPIRGEAVPAS
ncbi:MAG: MFS transporter [Burkholderiales bacterium]|nr:MFS transporter [Anaerolineae bacterium]